MGMSILLLATQGASAQHADTSAVLRELRIREVGISGSRQTPVRTVMSQTPLFDRKAQAAAPCQTLEAALRNAPSVDIRERGGKGTQADISVRGGSFDQTMVLLNGIDFTDARTGHQSHSLPVDIECISGVELLEGIPGVGAYAGAVNIRTAPLLPQYLRVEGVGGQYGYAYGSLSGAVAKERFSLLGAASYRRSDGYRHNTDFDTYNVFVRSSCEAPRAGFFDFQAGYQNRAFGSNGFYGAYNPEQWEHTSTALASLRWQHSAGRFAWGAYVSYRKNFDRYDWTRGTVLNRHNTDNAGAKAWVDCDWAGGTTTLGGDYAFSHIYSTNLGELLATPHGDYLRGKSRHTGNVYLRHSKHWRRFDAAASAGASLTPYGTALLWSLDGGCQPAEGLRVSVGASQSMRLPTFTDLYYSSPAQINNLDLVPEKAVTVRAGARYAKGRWSASATGYYRAGATSSTGCGIPTTTLCPSGAANGTPSRRASWTPTASNLRAAMLRPRVFCAVRPCPMPGSPRTAVPSSSPKAPWTFCAIRRRWPSRCASCAACRWRSRPPSPIATAAIPTIPCPATRR